MSDIEVGDLVARISFDDSGLNKSMAEINRQMKLVQAAFDASSSALAGYGSKEDQLKAKLGSLSQQLALQQQRVNKLNEAFQKSVQEKGADAVQTQKLASQLANAQAQYNRLNNELDSTNRELSTQTSSWNKLGDALTSAGDRLSGVGRGMETAGRSLTVGLTAPITALAGLSTKAAIDFESAFAGVRKTVNGTEAEFDALEQGIRDMAKEIPASAVEIAKVAEAAGQLGIQKSNILGFTRTMTDLGVATNLSSDQAATALARLANITQMPQDEFDRLGSTIVALGNNLATTESEIVSMGLRIAGAGKQIGLTEAQILAFAGALSSVGIEAEAGGSAISRVMIDVAQAVQTGSKNLSLFASVAGQSVSQFQTSFKQDAAGAVLDFIEGLGKMSAAGANTFGVLDKLGLSEITVRDALLRASNAGDLFRRSIETASDAWRENTALTNEAEQRYKTTASQLQIFKNRATDVGITLGQAMLPALIDTLDALQPLINLAGRAAERFAAMDTGSQRVVITIAALAAAAGPALIVTGKMVATLGTLSTALGTASAALARAGGAAAVFGRGVTLMTGPVGIAIAAIGALVAAGITLYKYFSRSAIPSVQSFGDASQSALAKASGSFDKFRGSTQQTLSKTASDAKVQGTKIGAGIADGVSKGTSQASDKAKKDLQDMVESMKEKVDKSKEALERLGDGIADALKKQYEAAEKVQTAALDRQVDAERKASDERIKVYDREYNEKLKLLDADTYAQVKALQDQIDQIDDQTEAEEKAIRAQEHDARVAELNKKLAAAETAEDREEIQADLAKAVADYERQQLLDSRNAQKEALRGQIDAIKTLADEKKEQLKQELQDRKDAEKDQLEAVQKGLDEQKQAVKEHYAALTETAALQAEARRLVVAKDNDEIIRLLKTYNPKWQDAGQSFADSFANGLNSQRQTIEQAVEEAVKIAPNIDNDVSALDELEAKLKALEETAKGASGGADFSKMASDIQDVTASTDDLTSALDKVEPVAQAIGATSKEAAEEAVDAFLGLRNKATVELNGLFWSGQTVSKEAATSIADTFFAMGQTIEKDLKESNARRLQETTAFFTNSKVLTEAEKKEAIAKLQASMNEQAAVVENGQTRIAEILSKALDEKRGLTQQEYNEITSIQQKMTDEGIRILSGGADEQKVILERLKQEAADLSAQQASEITQNSIKQRDDVIQAAEEQYNRTIAEIIKQRDESGTISAEQAEKLIAEARRQRDDTVATAKDMHEKVVAEAKLQAGEQADQIDWYTGKVKSKWEIFKTDMVELAKQVWSDMDAPTRAGLDILNYVTGGKFEEMEAKIDSKMSDIKKRVSDVWDEVVQFFESIDLTEIGENIIEGLRKGIDNKLNALKQGIKDVGNNIGDWLRDPLGVRSPSRVTMAIGEYTGEGLAIGLSSKIDSIRRTAAAMAAAATPGIGALTSSGTPSRAISGGGDTGGSPIFNFAGMFTGANVSLRSEDDMTTFVNMLAEKLGQVVSTKSRGAGIPAMRGG